jgi:hypothetical protein
MTLHRVWPAPITMSANQNLMASNGLQTYLSMYCHRNLVHKPIFSTGAQISSQREGGASGVYASFAKDADAKPA